jgi:uncharacterized SAM-binding protein YcdF (DUF218 family)
MRDGFSFRYVGVGVLIFVIAFFLLTPHYLGPDDLANCDQAPDMKSINTDCHKADAIVAISGGDTPARVTEAISLYKSGWAEQLIFSGAAQDKTGPSNAEAMKEQAVASGVPVKAILIEETSVNTQENALNTRALINNHDLHRIILVTSAYHQRRAGLEFRKRAASDGQAIIIINHPVQYDRQWHENWYLTPSGWWLAVGELVKIIGFYVSGS